MCYGNFQGILIVVYFFHFKRDRAPQPTPGFVTLVMYRVAEANLWLSPNSTKLFKLTPQDLIRY